jgi:hypothetical protein
MEHGLVTTKFYAYFIFDTRLKYFHNILMYRRIMNDFFAEEAKK